MGLCIPILCQHILRLFKSVPILRQNIFGLTKKERGKPCPKMWGKFED